MDLFDYFKTQFNDLEGAKKWYKKWYREWEQDVPNYPEYSGDNGFTLRAMAGHVSGS